MVADISPYRAVMLLRLLLSGGARTNIGGLMSSQIPKPLKHALTIDVRRRIATTDCVEEALHPFYHLKSALLIPQQIF
jgi:hypothetical protein